MEHPTAVLLFLEKVEVVVGNSVIWDETDHISVVSAISVPFEAELDYFVASTKEIGFFQQETVKNFLSNVFGEVRQEFNSHFLKEIKFWSDSISLLKSLLLFVLFITIFSGRLKRL